MVESHPSVLDEIIMKNPTEGEGDANGLWVLEQSSSSTLTKPCKSPQIPSSSKPG